MKGGKKPDVPLPAAAMQFLGLYVERFLLRHVEKIEPDTPLFFSSWGRRGLSKTRAPMTGKNICNVYGRLIGYPELTPHDLGHGVAMEVLEQQHDLEQVRALLGHARIDTTQIYASDQSDRLEGTKTRTQAAGARNEGETPRYFERSCGGPNGRVEDWRGTP